VAIPDEPAAALRTQSFNIRRTRRKAVQPLRVAKGLRYPVPFALSPSGPQRRPEGCYSSGQGGHDWPPGGFAAAVAAACRNFPASIRMASTAETAPLR
jgi:hypothetical protein